MYLSPKLELFVRCKRLGGGDEKWNIRKWLNQCFPDGFWGFQGDQLNYNNFNAPLFNADLLFRSVQPSDGPTIGRPCNSTDWLREYHMFGWNVAKILAWREFMEYGMGTEWTLQNCPRRWYVRHWVASNCLRHSNCLTSMNDGWRK